MESGKGPQPRRVGEILGLQEQQSLGRGESMYTKEKIAQHKLFFDLLTQELSLTKQDADIVAVLHILPDSIPLTDALAKIGDINTIVPKPKSVNQQVRAELAGVPLYDASRENILQVVERVSRPTVFLDIGGYFSSIVNELDHKLGENFRGIVEDTENGLQKYEKVGINYPFISVARSPLKENEDVMVGQAISFSAEALLRQHNILVSGLKVGVLGFGKIGRSVAQNMRQKQGSVTVHDTDNIRLTHAVSTGLETQTKERLLSESDAVCLATGNLSLSGEEFTKLKNGCWVFSVTSSDDEMDREWLEQNYTRENISDYAAKYTRGNHHFYLLNNGNAINFIHGTTIGDFILLVHAEILVAAHQLLTQQQPLDSNELDQATRDRICKVWLSLFRGS